MYVRFESNLQQIILGLDSTKVWICAFRIDKNTLKMVAVSIIDKIDEQSQTEESYNFVYGLNPNHWLPIC